MSIGWSNRYHSGILIIQQYLLKTISGVFDRFFEEESIGFRKGVSRQRSIEIIQAAIAEGYQYVIESDIEDFFPSVDLSILNHQLDAYIPQNDSCLKNILLKSIKNGYILNGVYHERGKGLAQGSPLSPILANLYLDSFDEQIKQWGLICPDEYVEADYDKGDAGHKAAPKNTARGVKMVRYADDFIILTRTKEDAENVLSETEAYLSTLGLKIKKEKTVFSTSLLRKCTEGNIPLTIALRTGYYITTVKPDSKKYYDISYEHGKRYYSLSETELLLYCKGICRRQDTKLPCSVSAEIS